MDDFADIPQKNLGLDDGFSFGCSPEVECFNKCCRDINLFLTPYDVLRIKRRLNIPSYEFLKTYTFPLFPEEIGHPVILLKMVPDGANNCPFVSEMGCMIYEDRPWSCRSFPLEPASEGGRPLFNVVRREFCLGFGKGKARHTVRKWRETQNTAFYEEINGEWKKITHHDRFSSRNLLEGYYRDIFLLGSYNIDGFRDLVFNGDFLRHFSVENPVLKRIKSNETELLRFAFKWLRSALFGDDTLIRR